MADVTFDEVFELAKQLDPAQRLLLAMRLEKSIPTAERDVALREALHAEHEQLQAEGAFNHTESLFGKFATPGVEWDESELNEYLYKAQTEWEQEMDDLEDGDTNSGS